VLHRPHHTTLFLQSLVFHDYFFFFRPSVKFLVTSPRSLHLRTTLVKQLPTQILTLSFFLWPSVGISLSRMYSLFSLSEVSSLILLVRLDPPFIVSLSFPRLSLNLYNVLRFIEFARPHRTFTQFLNVFFGQLQVSWALSP